MNRRIFLRNGSFALLGAMLPPGTPKRNVLVVIFQRGAVDGLNVVVPHGEKAYFAARPSIAIRMPLDLDGFFGLHPSMSSLLPFYKDRSLGFVHAVGSPDPTRSHFDAQDYMETGTPGVKTTKDGFLSRAIESRAKTPLRAVSVTPALPRILSGRADALAIDDVARFGVRDPLFEQMYGGAAFEAAKLLKKVPPPRAGYPRGPLAQSLRQIAQLIRADIGVEVAFAESSGWDTHAAQGGEEGQMANNLRLFADAIAAFAKDLDSQMSNVTLVTMSEFGRTVRENGNRGTDHGHATVMMALGGSVKGGRVLGKWPGLDSLYEGRDLPVTTDFRDVFAEVLKGSDISRVFPGYMPHKLGLTQG